MQNQTEKTKKNSKANAEQRTRKSNMSTKNIHKHPQLAKQFQRCLRFGEISHHIGIGTKFPETTHQIPFHHSLHACCEATHQRILLSCLTKSGCLFGELYHQIGAFIWCVASPTTLVEGCLVSCLTKSWRLFGALLDRIHW